MTDKRELRTLKRQRIVIFGSRRSAQRSSGAAFYSIEIVCLFPFYTCFLQLGGLPVERSSHTRTATISIIQDPEI